MNKHLKNGTVKSVCALCQLDCGPLYPNDGKCAAYTPLEGIPALQAEITMLKTRMAHHKSELERAHKMMWAHNGHEVYELVEKILKDWDE